jgi:hypothetical protein
MGQAIYVASGTQLYNRPYKERKIYKRLFRNYETGYVPFPSVIIPSKKRKEKEKTKQKEKEKITPRIICGIKCLD